MYRPHQLADDLERLLHEKSVAGANAWIRLFDQTMAELRFGVDGKDSTLADTLNLLDSPDAERRRAAAKALGRGLGERIGVFTLIVNTLAKDKEIEDKWRRYPLPVSYRNLANRVEDEVVNALVEAIRGAYEELAHRYYRIKAGWFGATDSTTGTGTRHCRATTIASIPGARRGISCSLPSRASIRGCRRSPGASSNAPGSMPSLDPARLPGRSVIPWCPRHTPMC